MEEHNVNTIVELCNQFQELKHYINCVLIKYNVINAFVIEAKYCNCYENKKLLSKFFNYLNPFNWTTKSQNICQVHNIIKKWFPELIETNIDNLGIILSSQILDTTIINLNPKYNIYKIIGIPDLYDKIVEPIDKKKHYYYYKIYITFKNIPDEYLNTDYFKPIDLLTNITSHNIMNEMKIICKQIKLILFNTEYCFIQKYIDTIKVICDTIYPCKYFINKLLNNQILSNNEETQIRNIIHNKYNNLLFSYSFEWYNPVHIGIIITILLNCEYDEQQHDIQQEHNKITHNNIYSNIKLLNYEENIIKILDHSKIIN